MLLSRLQTEVERSTRDVAEGSTFVVALSGGADSVSLLHALHSIGTFRLVAAHLDHQLRPDSAGDANFCRRLCRSLHIPLRVGRADVRARAARDGGGIEESARVERYAFLEAVRAREAADCILLAHTRDDQAETVLLRLLRGSGSRGLGAMRPRAGRIRRPMLRVTRRDVLDHLRRHGLSWREDPSNVDPAFLRNRVRHELIPYLESRFNPAIRETLARTASVLAEEADVLSGLASAIPVALVDGVAILPKAAVQAAPRAVARIAVRNAVRAAGGLRGVSLGHVDAIAALAARTSSSGRRVPLPGGREAAIHFDEVRVGQAVAQTAVPETALEVPGRAGLPDGRWVTARPSTRPGPMAIAVPAGPLTLRTRRPGDRVRSNGRDMSLKRFLLDRRIPAADRDRLPVIAAGHTVVWVDGQRVEGALGSERHVRLDVSARTSFYPQNHSKPAGSSDDRGAHRPGRVHNGRGRGTLMGRKPGRAAK